MTPTTFLGIDLLQRQQPYVIAEIGVNHEGSIDRAKRLIDLIAEGGADAAKFQTYKAEKIASKNSPSYWDRSKEATASQFELFKKYDAFGPAEYEALAVHCAERGVHFISTPFDLDAVEFLSPLVPFFKVASADITNLPLLRSVASKGKPVVLSTGASTLPEIDYAVGVLTSYGAESVCLLHCVLVYPTPNGVAHLGMIDGLRRSFPSSVIGYSDHTVPNLNLDVLVTAYLKGALVIEKHFTDDKSLPGNDHYHAMDVDDLKRLRLRFQETNAIVGDIQQRQVLPEENSALRNARRSIFTNTHLEAGHVITERDLVCKRPGTGMSPLFWDQIIGTATTRALPEDHLIRATDVRSPDE